LILQTEVLRLMCIKATMFV